jgi:hypothetical protein
LPIGLGSLSANKPISRVARIAPHVDTARPPINAKPMGVRSSVEAASSSWCSLRSAGAKCCSITSFVARLYSVRCRGPKARRPAEDFFRVSNAKKSLTLPEKAGDAAAGSVKKIHGGLIFRARAWRENTRSTAKLPETTQAGSQSRSNRLAL